MSIQQNPIYGAAHLPPSPTVAQYWREQHRLEARHFQRLRIRPNPELNENVRNYWERTLEKRPDDITTQSA